jgi:poly(3-hydroxyalkanoate) synthetase
MDEVEKVKCPVLFVAANQDDMVPRAFVEEAHARLPETSELASYDCGHFDLYVGPAYAENARRQAEFLARALAARVSE